VARTTFSSMTITYEIVINNNIRIIYYYAYTAIHFTLYMSARYRKYYRPREKQWTAMRQMKNYAYGLVIVVNKHGEKLLH